MKNLALLAAATSLAAGLVAQSNTVAGLDGRLTVVGNLTYWGRRGQAYPNGEVGMSMLNTMCNPGSVNIPWYAPMQENHPMFGFIVVRLRNDRLEQINEWSYCKHAFLSVNVNGTCGTCNNPGTSSLMGLDCSDTYSAGNNANRTYLGPPAEIDPWLNTWDPVGSYFDIGDPAQAGFPAPADGLRDLDTSIFDAVDNRLTVDEADLTTSNSEYFYGIQLMHQGEALANRWDNLAHRGFNPVWSGTQWSFPNNAAGQEYGSILTRWPGAEVNSASNGTDDGRFFVASKVDQLGGGNTFHYEYAVHNVDNSRAGGSFRVAIDPGATASNFTFGDIDIDASNDWTAARVGNEIVFTAVSDNFLEWNTIYNFGFDADYPPGNSFAMVEQARPGAGATDVQVPAQVPSGSTIAVVSEFGEGCGGSDCQASFYEYFDAAGLDVPVTGFTLTYNNGAYDVGPPQATYATPVGFALALGDDDSVPVTLPFSLPYPGGLTTNLNVCSNGFISPFDIGNSENPTVADFLNGGPRWAALWHDLDPSGGTGVRVTSNLTRTTVSFTNVANGSGGGNVTFQVQFEVNGNVHFLYPGVTAGGNDYIVGWSPGGGLTDYGSWDITANLATGLSLCDAPVPGLGCSASARPIIGTNFDVVTENIPTGALLGAVMLSLDYFDPGVDLTFLGMPGCSLYVTIDQPDHVFFNFVALGSSVPYTLVMPNDPSITGIEFIAQSTVIAAGANPFGFLTSNALRLLAGLN